MKCSTRKLTKVDRELASRSEHARWQAAIALGEFATPDPERIWPLVVKHGSRRHAIAGLTSPACAQVALDGGGVLE